jgi:hypothetical protein
MDEGKNIVEKLEEIAEKCTQAVVGDFNPKETDLKSILDRDPVAEAEKILENQYHIPVEGRDLVMLGHAFRVNKLKQEALQKADDSFYGDTLERYHRIITSIGFKKVLEVPFESEGRGEKLFIFWRKKGGLLLCHDTYYGMSSVNGGNVYFNWKRNPNDTGHYPERASGGWRIKDKTGEPPYNLLYPINYGKKTTDPVILEMERKWQEKWQREGVFVGSIDCREAIKLQISNIEKNGILLDKWEFRDYMWLLHHKDSEQLDKVNQKESSAMVDRIREERIALLPEEVREAITPS